MTSPFCGGLAGEIEEWEEFLAALQTRVEDAADCQELLDFFGRIFAEEDARNTMPTEHQLFQVGACCTWRRTCPRFRLPNGPFYVIRPLGF